MQAPIAMVRAYAAMMPRLQAQETLDAARSVSLGAGTLKDADRRQLVHRLELQAHPPGTGRRRAAPADPRALAMMGISVIEIGSEPAQEALSDG